MKVAIASPLYPASLSEALSSAGRLITEAAHQHAEIVCFPESFLPGYPGEEFSPEKCTAGQLQQALDTVCAFASKNKIAVIMPMDWYEGAVLLNVAQVISSSGEVLGYQTKNQLDPSEDAKWSPGTQRHIFDVNGVKFGIVICHEGFRYPESVRWATTRGAKIVFHPNLTGSNIGGPSPKTWGERESPYYEKAHMMRALENTVYFAASNYTFQYPESASSVIAPDGSCVAYQPYGKAGVIVADIDPDLATGLLAQRFKAGLYQAAG